MKTTNGGGEPEKVITEEAVVENTVTTKSEEVTKNEPPKEEVAEQVESFSAADLLKPKEEKPTISEEQRAKDRAEEEAKFKFALNVNLKKVNKLVDEGYDFEEALTQVPEHLRGKLRGIAEGKEIVSVEEDKKPDIETLTTQAVQKLREEEKGQELFAQVVKDNELKKKEAEALAEDVIRRTKLGHPLSEAILDASARLGLSSKKAIKEAEEKALLRGLRAAPPEGEPVKKTTKKITYTAEQAEFARRCGNDPEKVYGGA